jgi:TonB family protein
VSKQGLTLTVTVTFTIRPDGLIGIVDTDRSSGYADVDASVHDAVRRWMFSAINGGALVKGSVTIVVNPR